MLTDQFDPTMLDQMPRRKTKGTLGGWRPGSGMKPIFRDRVPRSISLEKTEDDALQAIADRRGDSVAEVIREAVQAYLKRRGGK